MKKIHWFILIVALVSTGCGKKLEKDVVGKWTFSVMLPDKTEDSFALAEYNCVSDFFANKTFSTECNLKLSSVVNGIDQVKIFLDNGMAVTTIEVEAVYRYSGQWSVKGKTLIEKKIDQKIIIKKGILNNFFVVTAKDKLNLIEQFLNAEITKDEGTTTGYVTKSINGKTWVFEGDAWLNDIEEKPSFYISATKQ